MTSRRVIVVVAGLCALLVVVAGASRATVETGSGQRTCPERVWSAALDGLSVQRGEPVDACAAASQERLFTVSIALMGLVLISGLLSRARRD